MISFHSGLVEQYALSRIAGIILVSVASIGCSGDESPVVENEKSSPPEIASAIGEESSKDLPDTTLEQTEETTDTDATEEDVSKPALEIEESGSGQIDTEQGESDGASEAVLTKPESLTTELTVQPSQDSFWKNISANGLEDTREGVFAFPGATGFGRFSTGGRGGSVYCVNTLEDINVAGDGLISYREAVSGIHEAESQSRIVTFCVSGEINTGTERVLVVRGNLTVACQSAPYPGVVLTGYRPIDIDNNADNQIWRHCDVKPRDTLSSKLNIAQRNLSIGGGVEAPDNLIFDHMSLMYSTDDSFVIYVNTDSSTAVPSNITLSQSIIAEGDTTCRRDDGECGNAQSRFTGDYRWPNHSMGPASSSHNGTAIKGLSFVANLIGNTNARNPQLRGVSPGEVANNLMFNLHSAGVFISSPKNGAPNDVYVEGNLFKDGPDNRKNTDRITYRTTNTRVVVKNNTRISTAGEITNNYRENAEETLLAGARAYTTGDNRIQLECVGASRPMRDSEDNRIVRELNGAGTDPVLDSAEVGIGPRVAPVVPPCTAGHYCFFEPGESDQGQRDYSSYLEESVHPADYDSDSDGIEDAWEYRVIELDGNDSLESLVNIDHTTDSDGDGYLDVEEWLNELAQCQP